MERVAGFTLIELIIVIVIIGVLLTVGGGINYGYLPVARDNERADDVASISRLLELAYLPAVHAEPGYPPTDTFISDITNKTGTAYRVDTEMFKAPGAGASSVVAATATDPLHPAGPSSPVVGTYYYQALTAANGLCTSAGTVCTSYKLIYKRESGTGATVIVDSARQQ